MACWKIHLCADMPANNLHFLTCLGHRDFSAMLPATDFGQRMLRVSRSGCQWFSWILVASTSWSQWWLSTSSASRQKPERAFPRLGSVFSMPFVETLQCFFHGGYRGYPNSRMLENGKSMKIPLYKMDGWLWGTPILGNPPGGFVWEFGRQTHFRWSIILKIKVAVWMACPI